MSDDDQEQGHDTALAEIPHEQALEQKPVPFWGDELAAALTASGNIYITLSAMCRALGLNTQAQLRRILRTPTLARGLRAIPLETRGGRQEANCLRVDKVALWLAGVEPARVKPQFRAKIEAYQEELAPVATQIFLRVAGLTPAQLVPTPADPQTAAAVAAIVEQISALTDTTNLLREHLDALLASSGHVSARLDEAVSLLESLAERQDATEAKVSQIDVRTQHLTPAHARTVQELVDRIVRETKRLPVPLTYTTLYGRLKHHFRVASYSQVPDNRFDELMAFLRDELKRATSGQAPEQGSLF